MLIHRGFEAWIECDGEPLTSYSAWCDGRIIGASVASVAGKPFGVHWRDIQGGVESFGVVQIDGNIIGGRALNGQPGRAVAKSTCKVDGDLERGLVFSQITATEDDHAVEQLALSGTASNANFDMLGTIELRIQLVRYGDFKRPARNPGFSKRDPRDMLAPITVHETSKKLGAHQACLGPSSSSHLPIRRSSFPQRPQRKRLPYDPGDDGPYAIFKFTYAARDVLAAQGIIPRSELQLRPLPQPHAGSEPPVPRPAITDGTTVPSGRAASEGPESATPNQLTLRNNTTDLAISGHARAKSLANDLSAVDLLHEQLRQAKEGLEASRRALEDTKLPPERASAPPPDTAPFSLYNYFQPGEVIDLTDL